MRVRHAVPAETAARLRSLGDPSLALIAALVAFVSRYSGEDEGRLGIFGAQAAEPEPLRIAIADDPPFRELVARVETERRAAGAPPDGGDLLRVALSAAGADLVLSYAESELAWTPAGDSIAPEATKRIAANFGVLLADALRRPEAPVSRLQVMTEGEVETVTVRWNDTAKPFPDGVGVHALFEARADEDPEAVAVAADGETLTYAELDRRANRLARHLLASGAEEGEVVGLCVGRSPRAIVALLAIAKMGAAYLPLDPTFPEQRLAFMLESAGARLVVTEAAHVDELPRRSERPIVFEEIEADLARQPDGRPAPARSSGDSLAYVMYTSGSTGAPKGVEIVHRGIARLVTDDVFADFRRDDAVLHFAPLTFDASTLEIWGALTRGARLELAPDRRLSLRDFADVLEARAISVLWLTAGFFHQLAEFDPTCFAAVRRLLVGGDVVSPQSVRRVLAACPVIEVVNGYGPTENTTFTCCHLIASPDDLGAAGVPIGRPIANTTVHVVDRHLRPVPIGAHGELVTGGAGLARGYAKRPDLTAERFVVPVDGPLARRRLYRTGDVVRSREDGALEFVGRQDLQVKIRGYRVELGEIEVVLGAHEAVKQVAVLVEDEPVGGKRLVAYVTTAVPPEDVARELRSFLADRLPPFMVPSRFVALAELPLTPNGKVDRSRLAATAAAPAP